MNKYQAVIIGFGKAGKTLAVTLAKAGWRVALIEQSNAMYGGYEMKPVTVTITAVDANTATGEEAMK